MKHLFLSMKNLLSSSRRACRQAGTQGSSLDSSALPQNDNKLDATVGEGVIKAGTTEVTIPNTHVTPGVKIFVTANSDTNEQGLVVKEKKNGLFKVSVKNKLSTDVKFDYWIVKVE